MPRPVPEFVELGGGDQQVTVLGLAGAQEFDQTVKVLAALRPHFGADSMHFLHDRVTRRFGGVIVVHGASPRPHLILYSCISSSGVTITGVTNPSRWLAVANR